AVKAANETSGVSKSQEPVERMLPPVVRIISPKYGTELKSADVTIEYVVRTPSGEPVTGIKVLVDGRPVTFTEVDSGVVRITIPPQDCEVSLIAENKYASSVPDMVRLIWDGKEVPVGPKLYILAIGVNNYKRVDPQKNLKFAVKDAEDFANAFKLQKGLLYSDVVTRVLVSDVVSGLSTDVEASKENILDGFKWILRQTTSKDVAMIFMSGHGIDDSTGYHYLPYLSAEKDYTIEALVPFSEIKKTVTSIAGKSLLFLDTCHSGNVMGPKSDMGAKSDMGVDLTRVINDLVSAENGVVVFASSTGRQLSFESLQWGNGAFAKALVEGVKGEAVLGKSGKITINTLDAYISERVRELTGRKQTPTTTKPQTIPDFPIAVKKK
ncbi:caspase family protein, partial [Candidatus Magnetobacterium casense]